MDLCRVAANIFATTKKLVPVWLRSALMAHTTSLMFLLLLFIIIAIIAVIVVIAVVSSRLFPYILVCDHRWSFVCRPGGWRLFRRRLITLFGWWPDRLQRLLRLAGRRAGRSRLIARRRAARMKKMIGWRQRRLTSRRDRTTGRQVRATAVRRTTG